jgi:hypothetical protein
MNFGINTFLKISSVVVSALLAGYGLASACPSDQYEDGLFHVCMPYGPKIPPIIAPGQFSCAQWALNPMYFEAVLALNNTKDQLAQIGVRDQNTCIATKSQVSAVIKQYYDFAIGLVADDLFRCACMNAEFASSAPSTPPYLRCRVDPSALPPGTAVTSCDASGSWGSACTCQNFASGGTYPGKMDSFPRISGLKCLINAYELPPGTPKSICDASGAQGSPCTCPNFATGGTYSGVLTPF